MAIVSLPDDRPQRLAALAFGVGREGRHHWYPAHASLLHEVPPRRSTRCTFTPLQRRGVVPHWPWGRIRLLLRLSTRGSRQRRPLWLDVT